MAGVVTYWERCPPLAVLATARVVRVNVESKADPKAAKDSTVLTLPSG